MGPVIAQFEAAATANTKRLLVLVRESEEGGTFFVHTSNGDPLSTRAKFGTFTNMRVALEFACGEIRIRLDGH